ncbi:hypothetical protein DVH24_005792 [Malus domestica]|uniref:Protein kinase domain-containing protein n=1 Tax=Malus domestica TaxID=3750 RepID=A0A498IK47_MALDO|nr:hypothetical protein DVH24_005792 [Malus domestica]
MLEDEVCGSTHKENDISGSHRDSILFYFLMNSKLYLKILYRRCLMEVAGISGVVKFSGAKGSIIHRDVKSTNILLDEKMVAKVLDFGLSKMGMASTSKTHISTVVKVLWEVLCARPALMQKVEATQINLTELANSCHGDGTFDQIIDPNVKGKIEVECLNKFVDIAISCLHDKGIERPSMNDVVRGLELALQLHQKGIGSKGDNGFAYGNDNGDDEYSEQCIFVTIFSKINDTDGK